MRETNRLMNSILNATAERFNTIYYADNRTQDEKLRAIAVQNMIDRYHGMSRIERLKFKISQIWHPRNP